MDRRQKATMKKVKQETYHFPNPTQRRYIALNERATIINMIRRRNAHRISNNDIALIPPSRHSPTESIEESLRFARNALPASCFALMCLCDRGGFARFQGADIEGVDGGLCFCEGVGWGRGEGEELEGLDPSYGD